ncbi:MAG: hypothetical protein ACFFET_18060 [Candidatus Thorarchaeota archaeon]
MLKSGDALKRILKSIFWNGLRLLIILLIPLSLYFSNDSTGTSITASNDSYFLQTYTGEEYRTLFRWYLLQYPLSLLLGLLAFGFKLRLDIHDSESFPRFSALFSGLVLLAYPIYLFIQFFSVGSAHVFDIATNSPVSVGYCSLLFIGLILLPSVAWHCDSVPTRNTDEMRRSLKDVILSPKSVSLFLLLCTLVLPAMVLSQAGPSFSTIYSPFTFAGFLLLFDYSRYIGVPYSTFAVTIQDPFAWATYGISIAVSLANLLFVWTVVRYVLGRGSKRTAYITGFSMQIPSVIYMLFAIVFLQNLLVIPFPATFVIGLVLLQYVPAIEPLEEEDGEISEESEMKVPFMLMLRSRLSALRQRSKKRIAEDETPNEDT